MPDDVGIPKRLQKASLGFIPNPKGKRSLYYMSIMKEAHTKMRKDGESDESFKKRFTAERSRQFDLLMSEEAAFQRADGCSERLGELLQPEYQLRPSDGRRLNYVIKEHKEAVEKLKGLVKILSDHDSMLFQANGITLNHDKKFHHDFNVEHIARIETKLLNVSGELENLEKNKETFDQIFKGLTGNYASKKRKLKENRRKSKSRKRKRFENNVRRVYHICVANPLAKELPSCLLYPPSLTIPEACINVEDVAAVLLTRDAAFIAHLLQSNYFSNAAGSRLITNLKPEVRNRMYCFLHPEDYSSNVGDTNKDEEENDEEEEEGEDNEEEQEGEEDEDSDDEIKGNVENDELDTL